MPLDKRRIDVMVSSTTKDLGEHRRRVGEVISRFQMVPRIMDLDSTTGKDGIRYSLDLVDEAEIYILLLGWRYGYVPVDSRNPKQISITQMEYERALEREARGELLVLPFVMKEDHPVMHDHIEVDPDNRRKLDAFRALVLNKQIAFFSSIDDLEKQVMQALSQSDVVRRFQSVDREDRPFEPRIGEMLDGRYVFVEKVGQGGNGEVWRATEQLPDAKSTVEVAIKLLTREVSANAQRVERFKHEISLARRLKHHPNIIRTTHWGEVGGQFYAVMDYITGQTLREFMQGRIFTDQETVRYLGQVAEALQAAHKIGVVHRDVKPENILVQDGNLFLGDFGLAISPEEDVSITETGELVGTKKYMSPEQWDNQPTTAQTDIYALGIIAYEMLTGAFPFDLSSPARLMRQHLDMELPAHPRLPDEILRIVRRAAAKRPAERYASAVEFMIELAHWQEDPANLDTKISKYLDTLYSDWKGNVLEQMFVDLEGDARQIIAAHAVEARYSSDSYLDDLFRDFLIDLDADHHAPQTKAPTHVPNILDRLMQSDRVVLVGEPGAGKSFTLRRLVIAYVKRYAELSRIPVFVPLNAFKGVDADGKPQTFTVFIQQQMGDLRPYYAALLRDKRLVLIGDALNEMPRTSAAGRDLVSEVRETLKNVPAFVVSCRVRDYHNDLDALELERLEVRDLELPAIHQFILKYLREGGQVFWERIGGNEDLFIYWREVREQREPDRFWDEKQGIPNYTSVTGDRAWRAMWSGAKLIPLARNPYMARVLCSLNRQDRLPSNRAELYQAFVTDLYQREAKQAHVRGQTFPDRERLEAFLTGLANQMQTEQTTILKRQSIPGEADLLQAALDATLLTQEGDEVRFAHQLLQEYFAAKTLAQQMYADADPRPLLGAAWWEQSVWRETALMLAEFTNDAERVVRWLGQATPELALQTWQRFNPSGVLSTETQQILIASAREKVTETDPRGRAAAYRVLEVYAADLRPGIGLRPDGLPDIDWVEIPAGEFIYGEGKTQTTLSLERFWIAKYPITYMQFQTFLDAPDGFERDEWWDGLDATYRKQPMSEQNFKFANHPRESVSWFQAIAFTRWLTWRMRGQSVGTMRASSAADNAGVVPTRWNVGEQVEIRLPTEWEWEKAARGTNGNVFPWGAKYIPGYANVNEPRESAGPYYLQQTSAVGLYPQGASPYGVLDMSGNVWEWCLNKHGSPQDIELNGTDVRVLRGGSWGLSPQDARAARRFFTYPNDRGGSIGFRVVLGSPPTSRSVL